MKWQISLVAFMASLALAAPQAKAAKGDVNNAANNGDGVSSLSTTRLPFADKDQSKD